MHSPQTDSSTLHCHIETMESVHGLSSWHVCFLLWAIDLSSMGGLPNIMSYYPVYLVRNPQIAFCWRIRSKTFKVYLLWKESTKRGGMFTRHGFLRQTILKHLWGTEIVYFISPWPWAVIPEAVFDCMGSNSLGCTSDGALCLGWLCWCCREHLYYHNSQYLVTSTTKGTLWKIKKWTNSCMPLLRGMNFLHLELFWGLWDTRLPHWPIRSPKGIEVREFPLKYRS